MPTSPPCYNLISDPPAPPMHPLWCTLPSYGCCCATSTVRELVHLSALHWMEPPCILTVLLFYIGFLKKHVMTSNTVDMLQHVPRVEDVCGLFLHLTHFPPQIWAIDPITAFTTNFRAFLDPLTQLWDLWICRKSCKILKIGQNHTVAYSISLLKFSGSKLGGDDDNGNTDLIHSELAGRMPQ